jgi:hypothetical protein
MTEESSSSARSLRWISQVPSVLFVILCILSSLIGGFIAFYGSDITLSIIYGGIPELSASQIAIVSIAFALGVVLPPTLLARARERGRPVRRSRRFTTNID